MFGDGHRGAIPNPRQVSTKSSMDPLPWMPLDPVWIQGHHFGMTFTPKFSMPAQIFQENWKHLFGHALKLDGLWARYCSVILNETYGGGTPSSHVVISDDLSLCGLYSQDCGIRRRKHF